MTSGTKYLLDTNYILGLLKSSPKVLENAASMSLGLSDCGYSVITRMELLGFPGISNDEVKLITERLSKLQYFSLTEGVEDRTIAVRQSRNLKLPDAIIAATALEYELTLLTFDQKLAAVMSAMGE
ncbi:type II toxin-antitoxin system VapC family toxin [Halomonas faecis]|uniref:type II toxin-antitoxin system VapC family toxin n=1 Tax=Halomonas faecis TaxID=1562110 RepID=UPI0013D581B2|nr:type II toxin-antitoxin system VapC family toxin [Halomonas faecis]